MLLTIAIPTYNRSVHLARLLTALKPMTEGLKVEVEIIVSDNASTDDTPTVVAAALARWPSARMVRNATNLGADRNMANCFLAARGEYVWILGDDDIPKSGVLAAVLSLLSRERPDIIHLPSEWLPEVTNPNQGRPFDSTRFRQLDRTGFARYVNIWMTFVSGIIVRKSHALPQTELLTLDKTAMIPLGWVLPALKNGSRFYVFATEGVLATAANTGGYAALEVFGSTFPRWTAQMLGRQSREYKAVIGRTVSGYLPHLIWNIRTGAAGQFDVDLPWSSLKKEIGGFPGFWILALPAGRAPAPMAKFAAKLSRLWSTVNRVVDRRLRYRM